VGQAFFVNAGKPEAAIEFTELNPNHLTDDLIKLEKFISESEEKQVKPTKCLTFGCDEEKVCECHVKVLKNQSGEVSNSPAFFISDDKLKRYEQEESFKELKEEIFEQIAADDMSAHLREDFIQAAAVLKASNTLAFNKLKEE
jgi:hypothetical protein